jgi:hypothetical protein
MENRISKSLSERARRFALPFEGGEQACCLRKQNSADASRFIQTVGEKAVIVELHPGFDHPNRALECQMLPK